MCRRKNVWKILGLSFFLPFLYSCMDNSYDLSKEIDLTVSVGGDNLSLPIGNTEKIYLRKFIKVEDSELLDTLSSGEYLLTKSDVINSSAIEVNNFTVAEETIDMSVFTICEPDVNVPDDFVTDYTQTGIDVEHEYVFEAQVPAELIKMYEVDVQGGPMKVTVSLEIEGSKEAASSIDLSGLILYFPSFVTMKAQAGVDVTANTYSFSGEELNISNSSFKKDFYIDQFNFRDRPEGALIAAADNSVKTTSMVRMMGEVTVKGVHPARITEDIVLRPVLTFAATDIASVKGQVDPVISIDPTTVGLGDLPDFLEDDDVRMDLSNPILLLDITNPVDMPISLSAMLKGEKSGAVIAGSSVTVGDANGKTPLLIAANGKTQIALSRLGMGGPAGSINIKVEDLNNLIETIPENIKIEMTAKALQTSEHTILLGNNYMVMANYRVDLPLAFGKDLTIVYRDTLDDWKEDIEDYEIKRMLITADVNNIVPLSMTIEGTAIDANGNDLAGITVEVPQEVKACNADGSASVTPIVVTLIETQAQAMKQLDGLHIRIVAKSSETIEGKPLRSDQYLEFKNMKATVPGGLIIDMND